MRSFRGQLCRKRQNIDGLCLQIFEMHGSNSHCWPFLRFFAKRWPNLHPFPVFTSDSNFSFSISLETVYIWIWYAGKVLRNLHIRGRRSSADFQYFATSPGSRANISGLGKAVPITFFSWLGTQVWLSVFRDFFHMTKYMGGATQQVWGKRLNFSRFLRFFVKMAAKWTYGCSFHLSIGVMQFSTVVRRSPNSRKQPISKGTTPSTKVYMTSTLKLSVTRGSLGYC